MPRSLRALGLALVSLMGTALAAAADGAVPVHVEVEAIGGCSDAAAFLAGVRRRTDRVRLAASGESGIVLRARLTRLGSAIHGVLQLVDARGDVSTREVDGATCGQVVEALSLTAALAIDAAAARRQVAPSPSATRPAEPRNGPGPGPSPSSAPIAPFATGGSAAPASGSSTGPSGSSTGTSAAPSSNPSPPEPMPSAPPPKPAGVATSAVQPSAAPTPPPSNEATAVSPTPSRSFELGLAFAAGEVVVPYVATGGSLSVGIGSSEPGWGVALRVSLSYLNYGWLEDSPRVEVHWAAAELGVCPGRTGALGPWIVEPCVIATGGLLEVAGRDVSHPATSHRSWTSAGALVRAELPLSDSTSLSFEARGQLPFAHREFVLEMPTRNVGETPRVCASGAVAFGYRF